MSRRIRDSRERRTDRPRYQKKKNPLGVAALLAVIVAMGVVIGVAWAVLDRDREDRERTAARTAARTDTRGDTRDAVSAPKPKAKRATSPPQEPTAKTVDIIPPPPIDVAALGVKWARAMKAPFNANTAAAEHDWSRVRVKLAAGFVLPSELPNDPDRKRSAALLQSMVQVTKRLRVDGKRITYTPDEVAHLERQCAELWRLSNEAQAAFTRYTDRALATMTKPAPRKSTWTLSELDALWWLAWDDGKPTRHRALLSHPYTARKRRTRELVLSASTIAMDARTAHMLGDPEEGNRLAWIAFERWNTFRELTHRQPLTVAEVIKQGTVGIKPWRDQGAKKRAAREAIERPKREAAAKLRKRWEALADDPKALARVARLFKSNREAHRVAESCRKHAAGGNVWQSRGDLPYALECWNRKRSPKWTRDDLLRRVGK
jgi:hypothetical protein